MKRILLCTLCCLVMTGCGNAKIDNENVTNENNSEDKSYEAALEDEASEEDANVASDGDEGAQQEESIVEEPEEPKTMLTFIGHASVKIVAKDGTCIFIDPQYYKWDYKSEEADYILVTHGHEDHKPSRDLKLKDDGILITNKEAIIDGVHQTFDYGNVKIEAVPAANENHDIKFTAGYIVTVDGITFYHASDTSMIEEMKELTSRNLDYAMYPIDGEYNMGPEEATEVANLVGAKHNIPIHDMCVEDKSKFDRFTPEGKLFLEYGETIEASAE